MSSDEKKIIVTRDGPLVVTGHVPLATELIICDRGSLPDRWAPGEKYPDQETYQLCRCGNSKTMPYCDGTHAVIGFKDRKQPERKVYFEEADVIEGPGIKLYDIPSLCTRAEYCYRGGNVWRLAAKSSDPQSIETVIRDACDCPSGRLVAARLTGETIEPQFEPSISLIEMPATKLSGPVWVKGGIPIVSIEGWQYETRNRVTLCRCGRSANMPFCNGTHVSIGFNDGSRAVS
jgi:CDGSH-type Zn-finger protein